MPADGLKAGFQTKKKPLQEGLRIGAGTTNRTRDLLITSLCNNLYKSTIYGGYAPKKTRQHSCFTSVLNDLIPKLAEGRV